MQKFVKAFAILGVTATLVACGAPEEEEVVIVPVEPEPISGKF
ncbi:hypothetical protein [Jannaschia marina]|nr:hypothetical protein [Jannaschia marina]